MRAVVVVVSDVLGQYLLDMAARKDQGGGWCTLGGRCRRTARRMRSHEVLEQAEGHQNTAQASGLAFRINGRPSSTVAFALVYLSLCRLLGLVRSAGRSESEKDIEIMVLRHQAHVLQRQLHARGIDRRIGPSLPRSAVCSLDPGGGRSWSPPRPCFDGTAKRQNISGDDVESNEVLARPPMNEELVELIVRLGRENRRWGCVRIQGELRNLGTRVSASSVRRILRQRGLGPSPRNGPTSTELLATQAQSVLATDFFTVDTVSLKQL